MVDEEAGEEQMNRHVIKQCKTCIRKGMKLVKMLYGKFCNNAEYIKFLSERVYQELIKD